MQLINRNPKKTIAFDMHNTQKIRQYKNCVEVADPDLSLRTALKLRY